MGPIDAIELKTRKSQPDQTMNYSISPFQSSIDHNSVSNSNKGANDQSKWNNEPLKRISSFSSLALSSLSTKSVTSSLDTAGLFKSVTWRTRVGPSVIVFTQRKPEPGRSRWRWMACSAGIPLGIHKYVTGCDGPKTTSFPDEIKQKRNQTFGNQIKLD